MNYFEFYELPVKFAIDITLLRQKYFELSKQFHPDFFVNESEEKKEHVLSQSTFNNNAFKTLSDNTRRIKYILEITDTYKDGDKEILPQDFLMEMLDLNEAITEMDESLLPGIKAKVSQIETELSQNLIQLCEAYDIKPDASLLQKVKTIYLKQKYLLRIKEALQKN